MVFEGYYGLSEQSSNGFMVPYCQYILYCKVASIEVQTFYSSRGFTSPRGGKDVEP